MYLRNWVLCTVLCNRLQYSLGLVKVWALGEYFDNPKLYSMAHALTSPKLYSNLLQSTVHHIQFHILSWWAGHCWFGPIRLLHLGHMAGQGTATMTWQNPTMTWHKTPPKYMTEMENIKHRDTTRYFIMKKITVKWFYLLVHVGYNISQVATLCLYDVTEKTW